MTKQELIALFPNFSKSAMREFDDGFELVGKYVRVAEVEGVWDVFLCDTREMLKRKAARERVGRLPEMGKGLGTGLLNNRIKTVPAGITVTQLDGEAWFQSDFETVKRWLEENRVALGISKRIERDPKTYFLSSRANSRAVCGDLT
jgi:hypothetical protein